MLRPEVGEVGLLLSRDLVVLRGLSAGFGRVVGSVPKGSDEEGREVAEFGGRATVREAVVRALPSRMVTLALHTPPIGFRLSTSGFTAL